MSEESYEVSVWLIDGTRMRYDVTRSRAALGYLILKCVTGNDIMFNLDNIAGFSEPTTEELWSVLDAEKPD